MRIALLVYKLRFSFAAQHLKVARPPLVKSSEFLLLLTEVKKHCYFIKSNFSTTTSRHLCNVTLFLKDPVTRLWRFSVNSKMLLSFCKTVTLKCMYVPIFWNIIILEILFGWHIFQYFNLSNLSVHWHQPHLLQCGACGEVQSVLVVHCCASTASCTVTSTSSSSTSLPISNKII
jgi:hypothetical protein